MKWNLFLGPINFFLLRWRISGDLNSFGGEKQLKGPMSPRDLW